MSKPILFYHSEDSASQAFLVQLRKSNLYQQFILCNIYKSHYRKQLPQEVQEVPAIIEDNTLYQGKQAFLWLQEKTQVNQIQEYNPLESGNNLSDSYSFIADIPVGLNVDLHHMNGSRFMRQNFMGIHENLKIETPNDDNQKKRLPVAPAQYQGDYAPPPPQNNNFHINGKDMNYLPPNQQNMPLPHKLQSIPTESLRGGGENLAQKAQELKQRLYSGNNNVQAY